MMPLTKSNPKQKPKHKGSEINLEFEAIGTLWTVEIFDAPPKAGMNLKKQILRRIAIFDKNYSRFRSDSLVTKMSKKAGKYRLPGDARPMLDMYYDLYKLTNGLMTPLIGQVLSDAGYDTEYTLKPKPLTSPPAWEDCLEYQFPLLVVKQPVLLDFGALGKGYLVDIIGELLESKGFNNFVINAGGDILHRGDQSIDVALENPADTSQALGVATLSNQALCGSAGNRRVWAGFNHILDPKKLISPKHILAVWASAKTTILADAMTTALYFAEPALLKKHYNFDYGIIRPDFSAVYSKRLPAKFFSKEG